MGRLRLYSDDERREKSRLKSARWRAANLERSREITRNSERRRAAKRAIAEGREPGNIGRPAFRSREEKQNSKSEATKRWYRRNQAAAQKKAAERERKKRAAIKAGTYVPLPWGGIKLTDQERRLRGRVDTSKRRSRIRQNGGEHTVEDIETLWRRQKGKCVMCLRPMEKTSTHIDHHTPLSRGGTNDIGNLRLLHPTCNLIKGANHPVDFALSQGMLCW